MRKTKKKIKFIGFILLVLNLLALNLFISKKSYATIYSNISGVVIDVDTNQTVPDLWVICIPKDLKEGEESSWYSGKTDEEGKYVIEMVPPGEYQLFIDPESEYLQIPKIEQITVIGGKNIVNANLLVEQSVYVSGTVYKSDGVTPVSEASVKVSSQILEDEVLQTVTDKDGKYIVKRLRPNQTYSIHVDIIGQASVYTSFTTYGKGQIIDNVDLVLGNPSTVLSGEVTSDNVPIPNVDIYIASLNCSAHIKTDANGYYIIRGLKEGIYSILIISKGYKKLKLSDAIEVIPSEQNTMNFELTSVTVESGWDYKRKENFENNEIFYDLATLDSFKTTDSFLYNAIDKIEDDKSKISLNHNSNPYSSFTLVNSTIISICIFCGSEITIHFEPIDGELSCYCDPWTLRGKPIAYQDVSCTCSWVKKCYVEFKKAWKWIIHWRYDCCFECCPPRVTRQKSWDYVEFELVKDEYTITQYGNTTSPYFIYAADPNEQCPCRKEAPDKVNSCDTITPPPLSIGGP